MAAPDHRGSTGGENQVRFVKPPAPSALRKLGAEERSRLERILTEPVQYIDNELFRGPSMAQKLFDDGPSDELSARPWCNLSQVHCPTDVSPLPTSTLSGDQEKRLFLQLNYARYRLAGLLTRFEGKRLTAKAASEALWWHAQAESARCAIIQANVPLVLAMAKRSRLGNIDYAELISEGNMALLRSVDKFDCGRGFKFSTYACRAILKSFSRVAMRASRYRGRFPTEFDPSLERSDYLEQVRLDHEADCVEELRSILQENGAELNEIEVKVIQARFALTAAGRACGDDPKTLEQVGLLIGVTKERVRQIQNKALSKLRTKLEDDFLAA